MARKSTVYFGPPLEALTANLSGSTSASGRINRCADRYQAVIQRHGLTLTEEETHILGNCLSGSVVEPLLIRHLADEVEDSEFADSDAGRALIERLRKASFADLVATVEKLGF